MSDPMRLLELAAIQLWQSAILAIALGAALGSSRSWRAAARCRLAVLTLTASILLPLGALLPWPRITLKPLPAPSFANYTVHWSGQAVESALASPGMWAKLSESLAMPLLALWGLGAGALLVRIAGHVRQMRRIADGATIVPELALDGAKIAQSPRISSPMVVGIFRPLVVLPSGYGSGGSADQLRTILAHEAAHVRRHDAIVGLLQRVAQALLWWNPALYWINDRIDEEREKACDEAAVAAAGDPLLFAQALVGCARRLSAIRHPGLALAIARRPSLLSRRIEHVLTYQSRKAPPAQAAVLLTCAAIFLFCLAAATPRLASDAPRPALAVEARQDRRPAVRTSGKARQPQIARIAISSDHRDNGSATSDRVERNTDRPVGSAHPTLVDDRLGSTGAPVAMEVRPISEPLPADPSILDNHRFDALTRQYRKFDSFTRLFARFTGPA